jgi:hypothetical protein
MILLVYVLLLGALAWVGTRGRRWQIPPSLQTPLRALAVLLDAGFLALGLILLGRHSATAVGVVILVALTLGALVYLCGIGVWRGRTAQVCRVAGWAAMAAALAVPSTLSLALPLLVLLAPTLAPPRLPAP